MIDKRSGGIGVTPFVSITRFLDDASDAEREIDFYFCTELARNDYSLDELHEIADRSPRFRVVPIRKSSIDFVTAEDVEA